MLDRHLMSIQETERGNLINGGEGMKKTRVKESFYQCKSFAGKAASRVKEGGYCWMFMWLLVLLLVVWPVALVAALLYVLFTLFRACCECTKEITEFLYKGILLPLNVAKFVVDARNCEGL